MKLNRNVGRGCFPDAASVLAVQTALANIRNKQYRPYYAGRRDGKQGPKVFCAIEAFQMDECLPVTGKIETYGPCFNRLRSKMPLHIKNQLSGTGTGHGAATPTLATGEQSVASRVKQIAMQSSLAVGTRAPLPHREATALSKFIRQAGERGCPLLVRAWDIDTEGRFTVQMQIEAVALPTGPERAGIVKGLAEDLAGAIRQTSGWKVKDGPRLAYATERKWAVLAGAPAPSPAFLQPARVNPAVLSPVQRKLAGAAEGLLSASGTPAASTGETLKTIAEALTNTGMGGESGNRIAKMILERNADSFNGFALHPIAQLSASEAGIAFIRREENTVRDPNDPTRHILYDDPKKNCTIGYGTLVHKGPCNGTHIEEQKYLNGISDAEAERLLRIRVEQAEKDVQAIMSGTRLTQPMYDAYVSLLYNLGRPNAKTTWRVFENARQGKYREAAKEFLDIDNATGEDLVKTKLPGLTARRKRESELFLNGTY